MTPRPSTAAPILAVLVVVLPLLLLASYVGGYFWLGEYSETSIPGNKVIARFYPHRWQTFVFSPAAWVESLMRGDCEVVTTSATP